jgi:Arylsulfotransferase (ASST)/Secretion system C-terminal sorting domain
VYNYFRFLLLNSILLLINTSIFGNGMYNSDIIYLAPVPGSKYVTKETNIIIRYNSDLDLNTISERNFKITGSKSGQHSFHFIQTDGRNTIILKPDLNFSAGEIIHVSMLKRLSNVNSELISPYEFEFTISDSKVRSNHKKRIPYEQELKNSQSNNRFYNQNNVSPVFQSDSIPLDFPQITILRKYENAPGYIFLSNFRFGPGQNTPYLMILDNNGHPILYKKMHLACFDFKAQLNNVFTYFDGEKGKFYSTTPNFSVTDSFYCGNGYSTDVHELLLLPDQHAYLMSYDSQHVDMSQIIPGGDTNAVVSGLIIQEIDENKNVIFQWRSWDHFQITDATHENLLAHNIDYVHGNAIDLDYDGNVLISSRHMDEITKINRQTGGIIWRLGGKNNQFTFINDPIRFSHQHHIRRLQNGNYTLFDNGNFHEPLFSRAVEYKLDELNKTATLIWQYRHSPDIKGLAMGDVQRLPNGSTFIGWGSTNPSLTEVRPDGIKTLEITLANGVFSYRAFKQTWDGAPTEPLPSNFIASQNYPNPFNPITTIKYMLPRDGYVTLKIYDILGREIKTLISENQKADTYILEFNAQNLSSGIYFYKLVANGFIESKKMILVR